MDKSKFNSFMQQVHNLIVSVGGYWPPLGEIARSIDEHAELSKATTENNTQTQVDTVIDISIIVSCIANQYCVYLKNDQLISREYSSKVDQWSDNRYLRELAEALGRLARIVLCFEGIKPLKPDEQLPNLNLTYKDIILIIHYYLLKKHNKNLLKEVSEIVNKKAKRDRGQFKERSDPITSQVLRKFEQIQSQTACPFASDASLWGAPAPMCGNSFRDNITNAVPDLIRFTNVCQHHAIDGYVLQLPIFEEIRGLEELATYFHAALRVINGFDPESRAGQFDDVLSSSWQFTFNGVKLFILVVSDFYTLQNSRSTLGVPGTYALFQPNISFKDLRIPRSKTEDVGLRRQIRDTFAKKGQDYRGAIIDAPYEAPRFVKPVLGGAEIVRWWETDYKRFL